VDRQLNSRILEGIKVILREKSGKKLALRSVIAFLLVTVIVFFAVFSLFETMRVEQMSEYLEEIPGIIENRENELLTCSHIYEGDILARAELGLILNSRRVHIGAGHTDHREQHGQRHEQCQQFLHG
jgi:hypothetical protein